MSTHAQKPTPIGIDDLVLVTEPVEAAFTMLMPKGWTNQAHLQREHSLNRVIASAVRTDGGAMIHAGDPRIPLFVIPSPYVNPMLMSFSPQFRCQPYSPADQFYRDYVLQNFQVAPGFRLVSIAPSPHFQSIASVVLSKYPHAIVTTAIVEFEHIHEGRRMRCRLHGSTSSAEGMWTTDLVIASAVDDLERIENLALRMMMSRESNSVWQAAQQRLHEHKMAMGQQQIQHTQNMTRIMTQGHNQRMQNIQAFGQANTRMHEARMAQSDAQHQSWMAAQAQADASHRSWMNTQSHDDMMQRGRINAIREEHTVVDSSGNAYQVDIHHERYYVNRRDNTYIGTGATTEQQDLRRSHGVNPDDYEEVRIVR